MPSPSDIMKGIGRPSNDDSILAELERKRRQLLAQGAPTPSSPVRTLTPTSSGLGSTNLPRGRGGTPLSSGLNSTSLKKGRGNVPYAGGSRSTSGITPGRTADSMERQALGYDPVTDILRNRSASASIQGAPNLPDYSGDLKSIMAQIMDLTSRPDTPGQWISPYSQDYLNALGNRMTQAGVDTQQQFGAANQDVIANYARGVGQRETANNQLRNELSSNLSNLGLNFESGDLAKQFAADSAQLSEIARLNQATDTSFNTNLGNLFAQGSADLGRAAREGLLTPKEWQPPTSGLSSGEQARLDFLRDQYGQMFGAQNDAAFTRAELAAKLAESQNAGLPELTQKAEQEQVHENPLFAQLMSGVNDPQLKDYVQGVYDQSGGDIPKALSITARPRQAEFTPPVSPDTISNIRDKDFSSLFGIGDMMNRAQSNIARGASRQNKQAEEEFQRQRALEELLRQKAQELLRSISSTYRGVPLSNQVIDSSKAVY